MNPPARLLVLFAHPALHKSRVQRVLAGAARGMEGVTFHDLYEAYPTGFVDVAHEQTLLRAHDVVVFQHPFYWYSSPAILKEWQDLVLEPGFAYGEGGTALRGKTMLNALSAGGPETAYGRDGYNHFTIRELLAPFEQTARLCGMDYLPPFVVHGARALAAADLQAAAADYARLLAALRDGTLDRDAVRALARLNPPAAHGTIER